MSTIRDDVAFDYSATNTAVDALVGAAVKLDQASNFI
jgi:hypothetical protein